MVGFNVIFVFTINLYLIKVISVIECDAFVRCPPLNLENGRISNSGSYAATLQCNHLFTLVPPEPIMTCIQGEWDMEIPICVRKKCEIEELIPHGRLDILNNGNTLEVKCDVGYIIDGPSIVYCNGMEWNEELRGCKEHDQLYLSCDFESSDNRLCGWRNVNSTNNMYWYADKMPTSGSYSYSRHVASGSPEYFRSYYISLSAGTYGLSTTGRLISPPLPPSAFAKQKCLIFSYKITSGVPNRISVLKVSFGGIPHWETQEGEGRAIIGLYQLNVTSEIVIEGINCKAAIDNISVTEGESCNELQYEETDSCHDKCGKIWNDGCSCDWECHNNNNCCSDIQIKCPYITPMEEIARLYLTKWQKTPKQATINNRRNAITKPPMRNI